MFESVMKFWKKLGKKELKEVNSRETAKERLHLVLMQDRANVSADFLDMMKQEIIEVIKKYIDVDEKDIDVRLTNKANEDGTAGAPALYANIPIVGIKQDIQTKKEENESTTIDIKEKEKINVDTQKELLKDNKSKKEAVDDKEVVENKKSSEKEEVNKPSDKDTTDNKEKDDKANEVIDKKVANKKTTTSNKNKSKKTTKSKKKVNK